jgi:hypothetical protein
MNTSIELILYDDEIINFVDDFESGKNNFDGLSGETYEMLSMLYRLCKHEIDGWNDEYVEKIRKSSKEEKENYGH